MIVYKATNLQTGKSYIGVTTNTLSCRIAGHYSHAKRHKSTLFHKALLEYRKTDWNWCVLAECKSRKELFAIERRLIAEHRTYEDGYNASPGGGGVLFHSRDSRRKISESKNMPCVIDGIRYDSMKAAGIALGISREAIRKRILNPRNENASLVA